MAPRTRSGLVVGLAVVLAGACSSVNGPSRSVPLNREFDLRVGETVAIEDQLLVLTFDGVTADSRCPLGVLCIRAGDAALAFTAVRLPNHKAALSLGVGDGQSDTATVQDFTVRLVQLSPPRRQDGTPSPSDYVARLVVSR
jgi:hypothetical protein